MNAEQKFHSIAHNLDKHQGVALGKMMSSPGIQYNGKNFAFYHREEMIFRLGRDWKPEKLGIKNWSNLSPFKNKPPMYDWFCITFDDADLWPQLATMALSRMISGKQI